MFATDPTWDQDSVTSVVKPCLEIFGVDRYDLEHIMALTCFSIKTFCRVHMYTPHLTMCFILFSHRCVFASNFPVDRINGTFGQLINALSVVLQSYSEEEKQKFFASNAKRFYRL